MNKQMIRIVILMLAAMPVLAQGAGEPTGQKTLAATMSVFVFPAAGQETPQQSVDEMDCYKWAVQNTGTDPFQLSKKIEEAERKAEAEKKAAAQAGAGAGAGGAIRGAAVGALIGEIASDDPGEGAAYGAAAGLMASRRRARAGRRQAEAKADADVEAAKEINAEASENFKKAFSVCLEAKDYMVKY